MTKTWFAMVALALAAACGGEDVGPSGVAGDTKLSALTAADIRSICEYQIPALREREAACAPSDVRETVDECIAAISSATITCSATVADLEACIEGQVDAGADCDADPPACEVLEPCD